MKVLDSGFRRNDEKRAFGTFYEGINIEQGISNIEVKTSSFRGSLFDIPYSWPITTKPQNNPFGIGGKDGLWQRPVAQILIRTGGFQDSKGDHPGLTV